MSSLPLVVDLDGTIIYTDMLHESALSVLRNKPWLVFFMPFWLSQGRAALKHALSTQSSIDPQSLPYNDELLTWLKQQKSIGRKLVLCTAANKLFASSIAAHLGIFDEVIASDHVLNLAGKHKADLLVQRFGHAGFDYVGNSKADLTIWQQAQQAIVVNASKKLTSQAAKYCKVAEVFPSQTISLSIISQILRVHQWLKNSLIFIPILAAHAINNVNTWAVLMLAFLAFSLCASAVYIVNDLLDLEHDRFHPRKCNRPFASGQVPIAFGMILAPILFFLSLNLSFYVGGYFIYCLLFYFLLTCAYSLGLKRLALIDCLTLTMLYTIRIIAGAVAVNNNLSFWLLSFSIFIFLSLAFLKRYAELEIQLLNKQEKIRGRGYYATDAPLVQTLGVSAGYLSVLVLALYLNSDAVLQLYKTPQLVWCLIPVILFWISWMWLQAHRGKMYDDPLIYAVKDKASWFAGITSVIILSMSTLSWP